MKKYISVVLGTLFSVQVWAVDLDLLSRYAAPNLKGDYENYLDLDSVKEVKPNLFELILVTNVPPLVEQEGKLVKNDYRSEKMYVVIDCKTNRAKRNIYEHYAQLNATGSIVRRGDLRKTGNVGFEIGKGSVELSVAQVVCSPINLQSYIGKSLDNLSKALKVKQFEASSYQHGVMFFQKDYVTLMVTFAPTGQGNIGVIKTSPKTTLQEDIIKSSSIDGFDKKLASRGWQKLQANAQVYEKNITGPSEYVIAKHSTDAAKSIKSIASFQ